MFLLIPNKFF
ncbi:hypothetical protein LX64_05048 [Chitinophaga skermanii]|uniref:Uncharacterized protein n=1 Tax=Chitinophaga skermanii TaxID=331697 RepID=A0A327Q1E1_9BACT|nr:hypothetical protein LX64_05048 [Chitinophaga skermanii]